MIKRKAVKKTALKRKKSLKPKHKKFIRIVFEALTSKFIQVFVRTYPEEAKEYLPRIYIDITRLENHNWNAKRIARELEVRFVKSIKKKHPKHFH